MKFIPSKLIDLITEKYESSEVTIVEKNEIYCKTLSDYDSKIYFKNGVKYFGSIENGLLNGKGVMILPNGIKFTGVFVENKIQGKGRFDYSETEFFEGEINNLKRNGFGIYEDKKLNLKYEGDGTHDKFNGQGKLSYDEN